MNNPDHRQTKLVKGSTMDHRFTAEMLVGYIASERGVRVEDFGVAPVVVVSWWPSVVRALAESAGASRVEAWFYGERAALYTGMVGERRVSFAHVLVGAAGTVMMMEEMIACGARVFWGLGTAGSLQSDITIGTCLIPTAGISEEGTSRHYVADNAVIGPSPRLVAAAEEACRLENIPFHTGTLWTTDAPYRETMAKIEAYGRQGVLGVDMETSAMYALGQVRGVEVCNVLVVSDELCHEWRPAFGKDELREARSAAGRAILCAIALL